MNPTTQAHAIKCNQFSGSVGLYLPHPSFMLIPQSYLLIEIVPVIFLHVKIVIAMYGFSGVAGATPLHSTSPPGMLTV